MRMRRSTLAATLPALLVLALAAGCGSGVNTQYGGSQGTLARRSVNGFSTLREAYRAKGMEDRNIHRLTDRVDRAATIVWTPTHPSGIGAETTSWLEAWLRRGHRNLIYVVPDSGSESTFYRDARPIASPEQRLEYRRKYAESLIAEHRWQTLRSPLPSNGWFVAKPSVQQTRLIPSKTDPPDGESANRETDAGEDWADALDQDSLVHRFEWQLEAYDADNPPQTGSSMMMSTGPGGFNWTPPPTVVPTQTELQFESLVESESGETLLARVTSDDWQDSQILVVAGGSLLTNYSLTRPAYQRFASRLIDNTTPEGNDDGSQPLVGFTDAAGVLPVSTRANNVPRAKGAELLTEFPLSFVTLHIAIIGLLILLMLMPIFGRPRPVFRGVLTHFGDHLDAVATLMRRRGGEAFARRRISDYMKHVRDETSGPWVLPDPVPTPRQQVATPTDTELPDHRTS